MLIGHSYIRRIRKQYGPPGCRSRYTDITDDSDAVQFSRNLQIREVYGHGVKTLSQASLIIDLPVRMKKPECDVLFLDIGSNDIAQLKSVRPSVTLSLAKYLFTWGMRSNATHIVFLGVLPREGGLRGSVTQFEANRKLYNSALKQLCGDSTRASFLTIRGFEGSTQNPVPVSTWSNDLIHPRDMNRYVKRLRMLAMRVYRVKISQN